MDNRTKKGIMLSVLLLGCGLTSLLGGLLGSGGSSSVLLTGRENNLEAREEYSSSKEKGKGRQGNLIKVYVSGAVVRPGLYDLPSGSRADDAVTAAGGMTQEADVTRVNLALKLKDGVQVNVPYQKKKYEKQYRDSFNKSYANKKSSLLYNDVSKQTGHVGTVNINTASAKELEALPGIGPSMAKRIISYRNSHSFNQIEDLLKVQGIGKAKLEMLRPRIRI